MQSIDLINMQFKISKKLFFSQALGKGEEHLHDPVPLLPIHEPSDIYFIRCL